MGGVLLEDTRQQNHNGEDKHRLKHDWWRAHGVDVIRRALRTGDYMLPDWHSVRGQGPQVTVDTKKDVMEAAACVSGKGCERFHRECRRAFEDGLKLFVLVENTEGVHDLDDMAKWVNSVHCRACPERWHRRCNPHDRRGGCRKRGGRAKPVQGVQVARAMGTMHEKYGTVFLFCRPGDSARIVCELLGVKYDKDD